MEQHSSSSSGLARTMQGLSITSQRQARREIEEAQARMRKVRIAEEGRAHLTHTALEHVGALTAMEQQLNQLAPEGQARYREIIDSYTLAASATIRRWQ